MKVVLLHICLFACAVACFAQSNKGAKPDLSGTWEFDVNRSNIGKSRNGSPEQIKITQHDPELIIRRKISINGAPQERDLTYYTDGRGEKNPTTVWMTTEPGSGTYRPAETESKTIWSKDKVVTRSVSRTHAGAAIVEFEIIDELRLSADGKTLTKTTRTIPSKDFPANAAFFSRGTDLKAVYKLISK